MKYEYKTVSIEAKGMFGRKANTSDIDEVLNKMSKDDWDLIQMTPLAQPHRCLKNHTQYICGSAEVKLNKYIWYLTSQGG